MIRHKKVSTAPEAADPDKVGSQHWNDVHGYGAGAFVPVLVGEFEFNPPSSIGVYTGGPCASESVATSPSSGHFHIPIYDLDPNLKADSSLEVSYGPFFTGFGTMPSTGWKWTISIDGDEVSGWHIALRHVGPDHEIANPTIRSVLFFTVYATFWEPS